MGGRGYCRALRELQLGVRRWHLLGASGGRRPAGRPRFGGSLAFPKITHSVTQQGRPQADPYWKQLCSFTRAIQLGHELSDANPLTVIADFPVCLALSELLSTERQNGHDAIGKNEYLLKLVAGACKLKRTILHISAFISYSFLISVLVPISRTGQVVFVLFSGVRTWVSLNGNVEVSR
jgi:hypothetical protein